MNEEPKIKKIRFWTHFKDWVRTHRTRTYLIVGAILIAIAGTIAYVIL